MKVNLQWPVTLVEEAEETRIAAPVPIVPGSEDMLGWSFNIFGKFNESSKIRQILDLAQKGSEERTVQGKTYLVPNTVSVGTLHGFSGKANFCETSSKVAELFQAKAKVTGSYGAFSGEVEAAYSSSEVNDETHTYCVFDAEITEYNLTIKNPEPALIAQSVQDDPVYQQVLADVTAGVWNDGVRQDCFQFFDRFGTHFVNWVQMGGSLYWYSAIDKSYTSDSQTISVKATAEYNGLVLQAGVQAEADWAKASEKWVENRTASVIGIGGDSSLVSALIPSYGKNYNQEFTTWRKSLADNPSPIDFQLMEVAQLFPQDRTGLLRRALSEYMNGQISVQLSFQEVTGTVNGKPLSSASYTPIQWIFGDTPHLYSYLAYVMDRRTGQIVTSHAHAGPSGKEFTGNGEKDPGSSQIPDALKPYEGDTNYLLIFLWGSVIDEYGTGNLLAPSDDFMSFLLSCGATPGWHSILNTNHYEIHGPGPYALVGVCGSGSSNGIETWVPVSVVQWPTREIPENPAVDLTLPLIRTDEGGSHLWTPFRL